VESGKWNPENAHGSLSFSLIVKFKISGEFSLQEQPYSTQASRAGRTLSKSPNKKTAKYAKKGWRIEATVHRIGDRMNNPGVFCFGRHFSWRPCFLGALAILAVQK